MAQHTVVTLIDDLDGSGADKTIPFSVEGVTYEIDLSWDNVGKLFDAISLFTEHARRAPKTSGRRARRTAQARNDQIRKWAARQGEKVAERGRIPGDVVARYEADPLRHAT